MGPKRKSTNGKATSSDLTATTKARKLYRMSTFNPDPMLADLRKRLDRLAEKRQLERFISSAAGLLNRRWVQRIKSGEEDNPKIRNLENLALALEAWEKRNP